MPPTEAQWAEKAQRQELGIAYGGSASRAIESMKGLQLSQEKFEEIFKLKFDFLYKHWQDWYVENVLPPEEKEIQTKEE
ncbi:hypothetical protein LCGC14_1473680 [marine sediment metagenome]|uniref:Uncharacterized protein n=1 Tax=marine sediment metagenome TaxID=412755 RepID=A0A0F9JXJ2_9ZZZZ|nr:hypothetical protein [bacterium]